MAGLEIESHTVLSVLYASRLLSWLHSENDPYFYNKSPLNLDVRQSCSGTSSVSSASNTEK